jgi:hypothetical protein
VTGDAKQVVGILAWAQAAGMSLSQVTVGTCHVEIRGAAIEEPRAQDGPTRESAYSRFGGPALAHAVDSGIPMGELQPVVGRE